VHFTREMGMLARDRGTHSADTVVGVTTHRMVVGILILEITDAVACVAGVGVSSDVTVVH